MKKIVLSTLGLVAALGLAACTTPQATNNTPTTAQAKSEAPKDKLVSYEFYKCQNKASFSLALHEVTTADGKTVLIGKVHPKGANHDITVKNVKSASGLLFRSDDKKTEIFLKNPNAVYAVGGGKHYSCAIDPGAKTHLKVTEQYPVEPPEPTLPN